MGDIEVWYKAMVPILWAAVISLYYYVTLWFIVEIKKLKVTK